MGGKLTKDQKQEIKIMFNNFDENEDGKMSRDEYQKFVRSNKYHLAEQECNQMFMDVDKDKSGSISIKEFLEHLDNMD